VAVYLPWRIAGGAEPASGLAAALAAPVLLAGLAIYAWCVWDFATFGRGTPAPVDAPKRLVVRGAYRYTRNPMYVGVLLVILGQAIAFRSAALALYAVAVGACFHLFVVLYEERHLTRIFGEPYRAYCASVPRWLPRPGRSG
jgi:protein-S-isoprenylcysteine O-methyltransferase Ste14